MNRGPRLHNVTPQIYTQAGKSTIGNFLAGFSEELGSEKDVRGRGRGGRC